MKIKIIHILILISTINLKAQNETETDLGTNEITIVKDYNAFIEEAIKVKNPIVYKPIFKEEESKKVLKYTIPDRIEEFKFETGTIEPANYSKSVILSPNLSFFRAGIGSVLNPIVEWNHNISKQENLYNLYLKHHSAWLPQETYQKYSESVIKLSSSNKYKSWVIKPSIGYNNKYYNFYGNLDESQNTQDASRLFHNIQSHVKIEKNSTIDKEFSTAANFNLGYSTEKATQAITISNNDEYSYALNGKTTYNFSDKIKPSIAGGFQVLQTNFLAKSHKNLINIFPAVLFHGKAMKLNAGIDFVNAKLNTSSNFYFLPTIETEVQLVSNYVLFFSHWTRKIESNQLNQLLESNPYGVLNGLNVPFTRVENRAGGFRGNIKNFSYNAYFVQKICKDAILFKNDSLNPRMMIADIEKNFTINNLSLELAFQPIIPFKMTFKGDLFAYELDNLKTSFNLPSLSANLGLQYQYNKKLKLIMDTYILSGVKSIIKGNEVVSKINLDFNLSSEYNIYKNFYIFANVNNILNTKVTRYIGYNSYGINGQLGFRIVY